MTISPRQLRARARLKDVIQRDDIISDGHAPKPIQLALAQVGGLNPHGEPRFRLVLAQCVMEWHGGEFIDWPKGTALQEQGGMVFAGTQLKTHRIKIPEFTKPLTIQAQVPVMVPSTTQPIRRFVGMRKVKRYPTIYGWILQMWRPAGHFGARHVWESFLYRGNPAILMLGPYPERGAYEIAGERVERNHQGVFQTYDSWEKVPPISLLEDMIQFLECDRLKTLGASPEARMAMRLSEYQRRMRMLEEQEREQQLQFIRDTMKPYLGSSLAAGKMRTELADRAGIKEHVGN
jgi:hypothetical protein